MASTKSDKPDIDESHRLCDFPRRSKKNGQAERLRVESSYYGGFINLNFRLWYPGSRPTSSDDGYRPSQVGVSFREYEIDRLIKALQYHKSLIEAEGRSTEDTRPGSAFAPVILQPRQPAQTPATSATRGPGREGSRDAVPWQADDDIQGIF